MPSRRAVGWKKKRRKKRRGKAAIGRKTTCVAHLPNAAKLAFTEYLQLSDQAPSRLDQPSIPSLLGRASKDEVHKAAELLEQLIVLLGRLINDHIFMPWLSNQNTSGKRSFLVLHTLMLVLPHAIPDGKVEVVVEQNGAIKGKQTHQMRKEGRLTYKIQKAIFLESTEHIVDTRGSDALGTVTLRFHNKFGKPLSVCQGHMRHGVLAIFNLGSETTGKEDDGVLKAQYRGLDPDAVIWENDGELADEEKKQFARLLGYHFIGTLKG